MVWREINSEINLRKGKTRKVGVVMPPSPSQMTRGGQVVKTLLPFLGGGVGNDPLTFLEG